MSNFTTQELDLASDPTILLIKHRMLEKVWAYLEDLQEQFKTILVPLVGKLPTELNVLQGKISKGENYRHLPYLMLDFPAYFSKHHIIACRTMFYWGHFISSTFHVQGSFFEKYGLALITEFQDFEGVYFCVNDSPWEYHYDASNYMPVQELTRSEINEHLRNAGFLKISIKFPVEEMPNRQQELSKFLLKGLKVIETN